VRGKHNKLGKGERKVRLGQDSLPNKAISVAETIYVVLPSLPMTQQAQRLEKSKHRFVILKFYVYLEKIATIKF
jgi:hypothetical protein